MYVQIGNGQILLIDSILAVIPENKEDDKQIRSIVVTDDRTYTSPYRAQALVKKIEEGRL